MPGSEVADRVHSFLKGYNSSDLQHQSQPLILNWQELNNNLRVENQRQGTLHVDIAKIQFRNQLPNSHGCMKECQSFLTIKNQKRMLRENTNLDCYSLPSRGLLYVPETNSEGLGAVKSTMPQPRPQPWRQPGNGDMQLWQQHIMLSQLQELQRQRQLNQLHENRQTNHINHQYLPMINGNPVHDTTQMLMAGNMNWDRGRSPVLMNFSPQCRDTSLYGTPIASSRGNVSQYSPFKGISSDSGIMLSKQNKPIMQPTTFSHPFLGAQGTSFQDNNFVGQVARQRDTSLTLDPIEEKILFSMDENITGGFGNLSESADYVNALPSMQSGSWSALMQSAVAEASSSDTGLQEEWSGLTFQNTEPSAENQPLNYMDGGSQQLSWVDNNFKSTSSSNSKPFPPLNDANLSYSLQGLEQSSNQFSFETQPGARHGDSWPNYDSNHVASPFSNSTSELDQVKSCIDHTMVSGEDYQVNNFGDVANSSTPKASHGTGQRAPDSHALNLVGQANVSFEHQNCYKKENFSDGYNSNASPHILPWLNRGDSQPMPWNNQKSTGQVYPQQVYEELSSQKQGCYGQLNLIGDVANTVDLEKVKDLPDFVGSFGLGGAQTISQTSQHMLELLHKVDQSGQHGNITNFGSEHNQQHKVSETDTSNLAQHYSYPFSSQGFGLRLSPPSQLNSNHFLASQTGANLNSVCIDPEPEVKGQQFKTVQVQPQEQEMPCIGSRIPPFDHAPANRTSRPISNYPFGDQFPVLESVHLTQPMSQEVGFATRPHNVWKNVPAKRHVSGGNSQATASQNHWDLDNQNYQSAGDRPSEFGIYSQDKAGKKQSGLSQGQESVGKRLEAIGGSLNPSSLFHHNNLILHQLQPMRGHNLSTSNEPNAAKQIISLSSGNDKTVDFSSEGKEDRSVKPSPQPALRDSSSHSNAQSHSSSNMAYNKVESCQINLQMAPSWFKQYGTLKNGQMLSMHDTGSARTASHLSEGKPTETLIIRSSLEPKKSGIEQLPTTDWNIRADVADQSLSVVRSNKRKQAMSQLLPWHKEVTLVSQGLQNVSMADQEWAQTTNRLMEKMEDGTEMIENKKPKLRAKRRLALTTELIQRLLRPPPKAFLSAHATLDYSSVSYFASKLALGDACSLTASMRTDSHTIPDKSKMMFEKLKLDERTGEYFSKVVEDFSCRAKKLETDFLRLERASMVGIWVESRELEKFSIINRFAKFHTCTQSDVAETSYSSGTAPLPVKSLPHRYITAVSMPRKVPEGVYCLSL